MGGGGWRAGENGGDEKERKGRVSEERMEEGKREGGVEGGLRIGKRGGWGNECKEEEQIRGREEGPRKKTKYTELDVPNVKRKTINTSCRKRTKRKENNKDKVPKDDKRTKRKHKTNRSK